LDNLINFCDFQKFDASIIGNKAYNLATLNKKAPEIFIPESYVITNIQDILYNSEIIQDFLYLITKDVKFPLIMRSSTNVEDSNDSFAGLFYSGICQNYIEAFPNIIKIYKSISSDEVKAYCEFKHLDINDIRLSILVQKYKFPQMSGVMFTKHPVSNDNSVIYIEYKEKTSDAVTSGTEKTKNIILQKNKSTTNALFNALLNYGKAIEDSFGFPMDIEWVLSDDKVWVVQARKITT